MCTNTATDIRHRFDAELAQIENYLDFVRQAAHLEDTTIFQVNSKLKIAGLPEIAYRPTNRQPLPFSQEELQELLRTIDQAEQAVEQYAKAQDSARHEYEIKCRPFPTEMVQELDQWADHFAAVFGKKLHTREQRDKYFEEVIRVFGVDRFRSLSDEIMGIYPAPPNEEQLTERRELIGLAFLQAQRRDASERARAYFYVLDQFDWIRKWAPLATHDAPVNLNRQAFILLMTAFDAAVFDITRIALRNDFFKLIALFGEDDKFPFKKLADYATFDDFRDELIEKQLKSLYVKDILTILRSANIKLTASGNSRQIVELMELVRRRNLHVHHRG